MKYKLQPDIKEEIESFIEEDSYNSIVNYICKEPLKKERLIIPLNGNLIAEVDLFETGESIVEVEFESVEDSNCFIAPDWFGSEIKSKFSYNVSLFNKINGEDISVEELDSL